MSGDLRTRDRKTMMKSLPYLNETFMCQRNLLSLVGYALAAALLVAVSFKFEHRLLKGAPTFYDARVYLRAIEAVRTGGNPYEISMSRSQYPFVYPPLVLKGLVAGSHWIDQRPLHEIYLGAACLGLLAVPLVLTSFYLPESWMTAGVAMTIFALQPRLSEERVLLTGNITNILNALILAAGALGIKRNQWLPFYATILVAGSIKAPFLSFVLLPLLCGAGQLIPAVLSSGIVLVALWLQWLLLPELFRAFQQALFEQVIAKHDVGVGLYGIFRVIESHLSSNMLLPMLSHVVIMGGLVAALFALRRCSYEGLPARIWLPLILIVATLVNPRPQLYDTTVAVIPGIYVCVECLVSFRPTRLVVATVAIVFSVLSLLMTRAAGVGTLLVLLSAIALAIHRLMSARTRPLSYPLQATEQSAVSATNA
jgi:hypothetical protein